MGSIDEGEDVWGSKRFERLMFSRLYWPGSDKKAPKCRVV